MDGKKKRKLTLFSLIFTAVLFVVIVLLTVYFIVRSQGSSWNGMLRDISAFVTNKSEASGIANSYESGQCNGAIGTDFVIATNEKIAVYDKYGTKTFSELCDFSKVSLDTCGKYAAVYDVGGYEVKLFNTDKLICNINTLEKLVGVSINAKGWIAVCTESGDYKGIITVYKPNGTAVYRWYSADEYVVTAEISADSSFMAVLAVSSNGSSVIRLKLDSEETQSVYTLPEEILFDMNIQPDGAVVCISKHRVAAIDQSGNVKFDYELGDDKILSYDFGDTERVLLIIGDYMTEQAKKIVLLNDKSSPFEYEISNDCIDAAISKDKIVVAYANKIVIYDKDFSELFTYDVKQEAKSVIIRSDGAAAVVFADSVRVYK